jgi:ketosteroid isomerase-like protein
MTAGGQTPEELETLLEDALLMHDAAALAQLFEDASVLVPGHGQQIRGPAQIAGAAGLLWQQQCGYLADPRRVFQARDTALLLGDGVINVARRGPDGSWRYAISVLYDSHTPTGNRCHFPNGTKP